MADELNNMTTKLAELGQKIEKEVATKYELAEHADLIKALSQKIDKARLEQDKAPVFGSKAVAVEFIDCMRSAIAKSVYANELSKESPFHVSKADLNTYGTGTGIETVPTATSNVLSILLAQGGVNRRECNVIQNVQGSIVLTRRNGNSTAAFTAAGSPAANTDDAAVTASAMGTAKLTLTPQQISSLSLVSEKLLYASAVNIAEMVAIDLVEQQGVLEDSCVIGGDASAAKGGVTGITADTDVPELVSGTASKIALDEVIGLIAKVHESVQFDPEAKFYMSGATETYLRKLQNTTTGLFYLDPTTGTYKVAGRDLVIWHRLDSVADNKFPVLFGNLRKAVTVAVGRDMQLMVDRSYRFGYNQAAFRLTQDWQAGVLQPTAVARLKVKAAS